MKIQRLDLQDFMLFHKINADFSPNINIICGENSTGKTALIKLLYSCVKSCETLKNTKGDITKEKVESELVSKLQGVFRPDKDSIGRLVYRRQGSGRAEISVHFDKDALLEIGFGNRQEKHIDITTSKGHLSIRNNKRVIAKSDSAHVGNHNIVERYRLLTRRKVNIANDPDYYTVTIPLIN